jgi:hypothetical protein
VDKDASTTSECLCDEYLCTVQYANGSFNMRCNEGLEEYVTNSRREKADEVLLLTILDIQCEVLEAIYEPRIDRERLFSVTDAQAEMTGKK